MILTIIDYIVAALRGAFPDVQDVFTEQVKQGLVEPCFIVNCVNPTNQLLIGLKYRQTNLFSVQYFPQSKTDGKTECYGVCETLYEALEIIGVEGDLIRGTGMSGEVIDGVLVFTVNYNVIVKKQTEFNPMETLNIENLEAR